MANIKLYTWIDVQDEIESHFHLYPEQQEEILTYCNFRSYWSGLTVEYIESKITKRDIQAVFQEIFQNRLDKESSQYLILEHGKHFPIIFEKVAENELEQLKIMPSLSRRSVIALPEYENKTLEPLNSPSIFAFHSYKGGVGRTLHALALAIQMSKNKKVLLIDADFEAPGISWLVPNADISFADVLALVHGSTHEELGSTIKDIANTIKRSTLDTNLFVLSAFRNLENNNPVLEIKPEHIFNFSDNPFLLTDVIQKIGKELEVDVVIIDLRAGISELSTGWLLDPRIIKAFVTTLSSQSVLGTATMFKILTDFEKSVLKVDDQNSEKDNQFLIFSLIPETSVNLIQKDWLESEVMNNPEVNRLRNAFCVFAFGENGLNERREKEIFKEMSDAEIRGSLLEPFNIFSKEYDSLRSLPSNFKDVKKLISISGLDIQVERLTTFLPKQDEFEADEIPKIQEQLKVKTGNFENAEKEDVPDFLTTDSIRNLVQKNKIDVPIVVVIGAKGSGKTFLYKQIVNKQNWSVFAEKVSSETIQLDATILPVSRSQNINNTELYLQIPNQIAAITNSNEQNIFLDKIKPDLEKKLQLQLTVSEWRDLWLDYIAWSAGYHIGERNIGRNFIELLKNQGKKVIAVFDGLEELFDKFNENGNQQNSLAALLRDVPNWLETQPQKSLGVIVFVRKDIVSAAISQNSGQFIDRFEDYELKWNASEVLRLVYWIVVDFVPGLSVKKENVYNLNYEELISELKKLWGLKLGKDKSREAATHNWVLGSLANLKKEIQSRDIVRFLHKASELSFQDNSSKSFTDRILFPNAIRIAIDYVGEKKIEEIRIENKPLDNILKRLKASKKKLKFPCKPEDLQNSLGESFSKDIEILKDNGVIGQFNNEYYMAEIFRLGMKFDSSRRGRPKVLYI